jgi:hypothetical protein
MASASGDETEPLQVGETVEFRDFSSDQTRRAVITSLGNWHASIRLEGEENVLEIPEHTLSRAS